MTSAALRSVWSKFRARRRSYYSLWIFAILALLSLFAEFLANDRPWLILMDDRIYVPIFTDYTERDFGGELDWHVNYRDDYMRAFLAEKNAIQVWPPIPFSGTGIDYELSKPTPSPPDAIHWLGTDDQGRDLLARVLYGYRISIVFAFLLTLFTVVLGVLFGAVQGYYGGLPDLLGQRVIEVWSGMPVLFILIILASLVQPNLWWLLFITLLFSWMGLADLVRAEFLRGPEYDLCVGGAQSGCPRYGYYVHTHFAKCRRVRFYICSFDFHFGCFGLGVFGLSGLRTAFGKHLLWGS